MIRRLSGAKRGTTYSVAQCHGLGQGRFLETVAGQVGDEERTEQLFVVDDPLVIDKLDMSDLPLRRSVSPCWS